MDVPAPSSLPEIPQRIDAEGELAWVSTERAFILVDKSCGTVNVYQYGHLTKTYPAVFGRNPGKKSHEGDQRTPSGLYMIIDKGEHSRWKRFLRLDYPNANDTVQYWKISKKKSPQTNRRLSPVLAAHWHPWNR
jgi:murein L,D-transpeptidase YafK